jgi:PleD family two-component response regulator
VIALYKRRAAVWKLRASQDQAVVFTFISPFTRIWKAAIDFPVANTILVVDDEDSLRFFLSEELESRGYQVLTAGDGQEAFNLLKQQTVDLAIVDLQMPYLNRLPGCLWVVYRGNIRDSDSFATVYLKR